MKKSKYKLKKYLAAAAFLLAFAFAICPAEPVKADPFFFVGWWSYLSLPPVQNRTIELEEKQRFSMDEIFLNYSSGKVGKEKPVFTSNQPSVASVNRTSGLLTAKKPGTAKITASLCGKTYVCTVKVKKKGTFSSVAAYKRLINASKALQKYRKTPMNSRTFVKMLPAAIEYRRAMSELQKKGNYLDWYGFVKQTRQSVNPTRVIIPFDYRADDVLDRIDQFIYEYDPWGHFSITKASGKAGSSTVSIELNQTPTQLQYHMLRYLGYASESFSVIEAMQSGVDIHCKNTDTSGPCYYRLKKGSKTVTLTCLKEECSSGEPFKLKKGYTYHISTPASQEAVVFKAK